MNSISIIIVSWNTKDLTLLCLESISKYAKKFGNITAEVIVVDNNSADGTATAIRERFPQVILIESGANIGIGRANNLGIAQATGELVFFLNSDTLIEERTLPVLLEKFINNPSLGVLGCKLVENDGTVQNSVRGHPSFSAFLHSDTAINLLPFYESKYEKYRQKRFDFSVEQEVEAVMGAAMAVPKAILNELGGFDPIFFMYFEEADLCRRIGQAGYLVKYTPDTVVKHVGGASSGQVRSSMYLTYRRSMFAYFRKHEGRWKTLMFSLVFKPLFLIQTLVSMLIELVKYLMATCLRNGAERANKYRQRYQAKSNFLTRHLIAFIFS